MKYSFKSEYFPALIFKAELLSNCSKQNMFVFLNYFSSLNVAHFTVVNTDLQALKLNGDKRN